MTTVDLTPEPEPEIYRACAEASWEAPGTQRLWRSYQRETYVELMLARPDFCALVDVAYRAGREDAARAPEDFRLGASDFGEVFLEHAVKGCFWEVQIGGSDNGSPRMELDSVLDAAREHIRTEHNTERGSE